MSKRNTQFREDIWRVPQRGQQPQPYSGVTQAHQPVRGTGYTYIPPEYKNRTPVHDVGLAPFSQDRIKIPYSTFQRAGPHNERLATASKPPASFAKYDNMHMEQPRTNYEPKHGETRGRTQEQSRQRGRSRKRSGSLTRFINWVERKLTSSNTSRLSSSGNDAGRPSTAPGRSPASGQVEIKPPVATGIRGSFDGERHGRHEGSSQEQPSTSGYVQVEPHREQKPAGFDYSNRDTTGTTWTNFLELSKKQANPPSRPPPVPARPTQAPIPARRTPTSTKHSPQSSTSSTSNSSSSSHGKKPSTSNLLHKIAHPLHRQNSDVSELSFFCSGVDDEALEVRSKKRADIIERQKQQRRDAEIRREQEALERDRNNTVFAEARRRRQAEEEAEARLEARLRESMLGKADKQGTCCVCEAKRVMDNTDVCKLCAEKYPGIADKRISKPVGQDLSALTGPDPLRPASTVCNVDLGTYAGGPFARPPSSIYPPKKSRTMSGYSVGNPYDAAASPVPPPVPPVPEDYRTVKVQDGETRDTKFYDGINEVHRMYASGAPKTPTVPRQWRSARASGKY